MAGRIKRLFFAEGISTSAPLEYSIEASKIKPYADESAYIVENGTPAGGEVYYNTSSNKFKYYSDGSWLTIDSEKNLSTDITVTVGTGGEYSTLNAALNDIWNRYLPEYNKDGIRVTINMLSGFVMEEQIIVDGLNMGWITITGADAETSVTHTALTTALEGRYPIFGVTNGGTLPVIDQLFRMSSGAGTDKDGVLAVGAGSSANINSGAGFVDVGSYGIYAYQGSTINANSADASGAGVIGIYAYQSSTINAESADASGAGIYGIFAYQGSTINAKSANASNASSRGIHANQGSTINADSADASGAGNYGIYANQGSTINAESADASYAGAFGIYADQGSTIDAESADASNAGTYGIYAYQGSTINALQANASNAGTHGIYAAEASTINAKEAYVNNTGTIGIHANQGSTINAYNAFVQNQTIGTYGVKVTGGSFIEASYINFTGTTVPTLSQAVNTLTSDGIIFQ